MKTPLFCSGPCIALCFFAPSHASDESLDINLYGSWRLHANAASVEAAAPGQSDTYVGLSDAYSRIGIKSGWNFAETNFVAKVELGLNTADLELGDPAFFDDEDLRVKSLTASGDWGTMVIGKDWLPYYNTVGYPVDYFSSIFAGYSTFAFFRENQLTYITPELNGLKGSLSRIQRTNGGPRGWHYTASFNQGPLSIGAGMEDMDNDVADTYGASVSLTQGSWYAAAKYEHSDSQGDIYNVFAQFNQDKLTYKAGIGLGDQFAGDSYHIGVDYQVRDNFKLFSEFYSEQNNYAILADGAQSASDYLGAGGFGARQHGKVMLVGFRFDFDVSAKDANP